jgi:hypothetical protein
VNPGNPLPTRHAPGILCDRTVTLGRGTLTYDASGGDYVFTDLSHLDHMIARWTTLRDDISADGQDIRQASRQIVPPAEDESSVAQAKATRASLAKGHRHNQAMFDYANDYVTKLTAARARYTSTEEDTVDRMRNVDGDR